MTFSFLICIALALFLYYTWKIECERPPFSSFSFAPISGFVLQKLQSSIYNDVSWTWYFLVWEIIQPLILKLLRLSAQSFLEVVVHGGLIREKPTSKEEAREFIKGIWYINWWCFVFQFLFFGKMIDVWLPCHFRLLWRTCIYSGISTCNEP